MVLPAILVVVGSAAAGYYLRNSDGAITEITEDIATDLADSGVEVIEGTIEELLPILQGIGSGIAQGLGTLGNQTLDVIRGAIPAVIDGIDDGYDYIRNKIRGNEPTIIASITVGMLTILTGVYLVNAARRGTMTYKP